MSFKKIFAMLLLALLAVMEAGDFYGNVTTALSAEAFANAQAALGIGRVHEALRLAFLLPASGLITLFAIFVFLGLLFNSSLIRFTRMLVTVLILMALFHIIFTGILLRSPFGGFGIVFLLLAILIRWLVRASAAPNHS